MSGAVPGRAHPRYWGWHRLTADWAERVVAQADPKPGSLVLDLGAGHGALVDPLRDRHAEVLAIELHPQRAAELRRRYADDRPAVRVLELDLAELRWPRRPFHVVANPPWTLAVPLIRALTATQSSLLTAHLVIQRELVLDVARRGRALGRGFSAEDLGPVPGSAFRPAPPRRAGLLRIRRSRPLPASSRSNRR